MAVLLEVDVAELRRFPDVKEVTGAMETVRGEMKGEIKNLEAKMAERKRDNDSLETKNDTGIQERRTRKRESL